MVGKGGMDRVGNWSASDAYGGRSAMGSASGVVAKERKSSLDERQKKITKSQSEFVFKNR